MTVSADVFSMLPGEPFPAGASITPTGVNFSVFSRNATAISLLLFAGERDRNPLQIIELDPSINRTFFFWHVLVEGAAAGLWYAWQVDGPGDTARSGCRFDARRELLDPWAKVLSDANWDRVQAMRTEEPYGSFRAMVAPAEVYDWEGDAPLNHRLEDTVLYEMHVGGFTRHPSSAVASPGSFAAITEKIPYLQSLGITDIELMPVMAFDAQDVPPATTARGLRNYWGYSTCGFFALHPAYCSTSDSRREFRDMVRALHRAGIGVILDVVFNHTAEGGEDGPIINFKGLGNEIFYHLDPGDRRRYRDFSGCGNTVNCNHPLVARFIVQCLEYWVREMHVDGFRFDLASVLARGEDGNPMYHAPVLWNIEFSPVLARTRIIAEAWDASGLYQVGDFPGFRWAEWNGRYRDAVRRFVRGDAGLIGEIASRVSGSSDLYAPSGRLPINSINFVTCHDGFTLLDLVSHEQRHNEANGEDNRDGAAENFSCNCGIEGPTDDPAILQLRHRLARNHLALLLLSQGVPMLLAGDEVLRTQRGNNNAYCQDNDISWFDWSLTGRNAGMLRYTRELISLRRRHRSLRRNRFLNGKHNGGTPGMPDIRWLDAQGHPPDWGNGTARYLAWTLAGCDSSEPPLHIICNMGDEPLEPVLPAIDGISWFRAIDTSLESPLDISPPGEQAAVLSPCPVAARTVVVLEGWKR